MGRAGLRQHAGRAQGLHPALFPARARAALSGGRAERLGTARLLLARGEWDAALAALDLLLAEEPDDVAALLLKAGLLQESRSEGSALALFERATRLAPGSAEAWSGLARNLHALGRDEDALGAAREARRLLDEGDNFRHAATVYLTLVWCLRARRLLREALAAAEEGLARSPDGPLLQWASVVEEELQEAERERC